MTPSWIVPFHPRPNAAIRLFCLPWAGGSAMNFRGWSELLPESIEVCPIQLPGRANRIREAPMTDIYQLTDAIVDLLEDHDDRPYALFGHCMGAAVGFAALQEMEDRGGPMPVRFFVCARRAPHLPQLRPPLHKMASEELLVQARTRFRQSFEETPDAVLANDELMKAIIPMFRADVLIDETYLCHDPFVLPCPITVFGGMEDDMVDSDELAAWEQYAGEGFDRHMLQGGHFVQGAARQEMLLRIADHLASAQ